MRTFFPGLMFMVLASLGADAVGAAPTPTPTLTPGMHDVCVAAMRRFVGANSEVQRRYASYTSAATDTDNAGEDALTSTKYAFPLAYAGAELEIIHDLARDDDEIYQPALDQIDATGLASIMGPTHQLAADVKQRDKNAAAWSENRFQYFRYLQNNVVGQNIDLTPRRNLTAYVGRVDNDSRIIFTNPHLCDVPGAAATPMASATPVARTMTKPSY